MKQLPTAAEVRELVGELRLTREHFVAFGYLSEAEEMQVGIEMLLQFAELLEDTERVNTYLHERHRHPDYEYRTTDGPRKAWDGTPDLSLEGWTKISWERFDYHEEISWMRRKEKPPEAE